MHRFTWDLHYDPIPPEDIADNGDEEATGAVPGRTYETINAPWAPPGQYTVRLTVNGTRYTQPITVRMDPRVKTPAAPHWHRSRRCRVTCGKGSHETYDANRSARALFRRPRLDERRRRGRVPRAGGLGGAGSAGAVAGGSAVVALRPARRRSVVPAMP